MLPPVRAIVWMSDRLRPVLRDRLMEATTVNSALEFWNARRDHQTVAFLDSTTITALTRAAVELHVTGDAVSPGPTIAICEEPLQTAVGWLGTHSWLSHVVSSAMLQHPLAGEHLGNVITTLTSGGRPRLLDWVGPTLAGRRVRMAHASRREARLERMGEFFESQGVSSRTIQQLRDVAEELLTNAFYDAPVSAGALSKPISRTQDISLPDESACDMVYGCREDLAVVRVRDPFGSLTRARLVEVLLRCARTDMGVQVDETMGGAGLGLWRIFSVATFVAISVVDRRYTEFLVGIGKRPTGAAAARSAARPFAFHLFFREPSRTSRTTWKLLDPDTSAPTINKSVTLAIE